MSEMWPLAKLPWWIGFPISVGMTVMGVFAPSVMPDWWQKVFFFCGVASFVSGILTAWLHFRLGGWLSRHVWWRFSMTPPRPAKSPAHSPVPLAVSPAVSNSDVGEPTLGGNSPTPTATPLRLTQSAKERLDTALLAVADYLKNEFEKAYMEPIRAAALWRNLLHEKGPPAVQEQSEEARRSARGLPAALEAHVADHLSELALVDIDPMTIAAKAAPLDDLLWSVGSIAYVMKEPNEAALHQAGGLYVDACAELDTELQRIKLQISEARKSLARGEMG